MCCETEYWLAVNKQHQLSADTSGGYVHQFPLQRSPVPSLAILVYYIDQVSRLAK